MDVTRRNFLQTGAALTASANIAKPSANGRITVGMIGTGARAQELMEAVMQHKEAEIVAVTDAYQGRVARAIDRTHGRAKSYKNYQEILARKDIDAVVVATPDHWHKPIVIEALNAGKDVYCEKPLTYRSSEGPEIIRAAKANSRIVQVGSQA